jgi:hypothetical protein
MITYNDTTYCVRECNNMQCKINFKHIEGQDTKGLPVSMTIFDKCKEWSGEDESNDKSTYERFNR